ncbi:MAG: aspartate aminotransferase family protein [Deltaproteobacteria bacterium]|nr:aspartate aminotransferase family protein [Deltaproteobacteria bacterium]
MPESNESILGKRKKHLIASAVHYYKTPVQLVKAKGQYVYDQEDRAYLDCIGGIVCISAGHNHPKIKEKLLSMLEKNEIQHTTLLFLNHHVTDLAEELLKEAPNSIDRIFFTNSGSEANELAFMAARNATGETVIVNLRHSYHGGTAAALSSCGHHTWRFKAQPTAAVTSAMEPYCYRCPFGKKPDSCALECAKNIETTIQTSTHGKIAAFIAEPVMGVGGFITPPTEYFHEAAKIVHNYGGKYISDEVQTGVGRCGGAYFLSKELGIDADIITMAKGLGNGAPIGATLMTTELSNPLTGKLFFNTFGGDPFQTAQAKVTLEIIREEKLIANAKAMGSYLMEGLKNLQKNHSWIGEVRGRGLMIGIELVKNLETKEYATAETAEVMEIAKNKGVLFGKGGLFGNVLRIAPALSITRGQCDEVLKVLDESFFEAKLKF